MKTVSIIVGALAAFTVAAPAMVQEKRSQDSNFGNVNNFDFSNDNLAYLGFVNSLDFSILEQLVNVNSFNVDQFSSLFQSNSFDLNSILEFQQISQLVQLAQLGVFNEFSLSSLNFNSLDFGLINSLSSFDLNSQIEASVIPQVQQVIQTAGLVIVKQ